MLGSHESPACFLFVDAAHGGWQGFATSHRVEHRTASNIARHRTLVASDISRIGHRIASDISRIGHRIVIASKEISTSLQLVTEVVNPLRHSGVHGRAIQHNVGRQQKMAHGWLEQHCWLPPQNPWACKQQLLAGTKGQPYTRGCRRVCMRARVNAGAHACVHAWVQARVHACTHGCRRACMRARMGASTHAYVHAWVQARMHACTHECKHNCKLYG